MPKKNLMLLFFIPCLWLPANKPAIIKTAQLMQRITSDNDTTYIVNFWATWCGPCVKELPVFEKLNEQVKDKKVKVLLVSLDFVADYDSKLLPFLERKKIKSEVMLLNETKANIFIDQINPQWGGSIPATMVINHSKKYQRFIEESVTLAYLEEEIKKSGN